MLRSSVVCLSVILVAFLSVSYGDAFSARESKDRWMKTTQKTGGRSRERLKPTNEAGTVYEMDRSPAFASLGVGESVMVDPVKRKEGEEPFKPEAEYLLKSDAQRKKRKNFRMMTDSLSRNTDSLGKDLHDILTKIYKRKIMENQQRKLKYLNSDIIADEEPSKAEDDASDEQKEYEEDRGSWTPDEQLEKDYVHVARSTIGFLRQSRRHPGLTSGSLQVVVELLVIVDNAIYRRTLKRMGDDDQKAIDYLKNYYNIVVSLVDSRYAQIEDKELGIRVRLAEIHISKDKSDSPWAETNTRDVKHSKLLDPNIGLEQLHEWLREKHRDFKKFDHAMAFTGYSLVTETGKHTSGMAYIGTICKVSDGYSCSIIQEDGGLSSVSTAVHELGHSLGAKHDGDSKNADCLASKNYVMAPGNSAENKDLLKNFFQFSPCTVREFKALLSTGDVDCLTITDSSPDESFRLPGKEISPDEQCKDVFGPESGYCEPEEGQASDEICARLWCVKPGQVDSCVTRGHLTAVLGTPCGENKVCKNGQCLDERQVSESFRGNGNSRNETTVTNRISPTPKQHQPNAATETPIKTELGRPRCKEDVYPEYCRKTVYMRPDVCNRSNVAVKCCFSCSHVSQR